LALLRGRDYVVPQDVLEVIPDVLRHRLVLSYDALADEVSPDDVISRVLQTVGLPQIAAQPTTVPAGPAGHHGPPVPSTSVPGPTAMSQPR
jgi:MoxR-like ATPase